MEWSNDKVLKLIEAYRERPVLWDSTDAYYKNRNRKEDAWAELANMLDTNDTSEIKKKIQSLLASFRREKQKLKPTSGMGTEEVYNTKWFAFSSLLFLKDKNKPRETQDTETGVNDPFEDYSQQENTEEVGTTEDMNNDVQQSAVDEENGIEEIPEDKNTKLQEPKRKQSTYPTKISKKEKFKEDPRITEAYSVLSTFKQNTRDDCCVYGEHVGLKLRSYDTQTRAIVQHHLNNILFNADMGMYGHGYQHPFQRPPTSSSHHAQFYNSNTPSPAASLPSVERNLHSNNETSSDDAYQASYASDMSQRNENLENGLTSFFSGYKDNTITELS
ncbi:hypothetical protein RI129_002715 [Pyrocoelia pectoralis]|uniref:MADF domain-containing protein n=1 Tax=Pyrocoelia pectoralis TaxID=417401 RepID=A0AAN7VNH6_9COLE